jgi:hypothetical protein
LFIITQQRFPKLNFAMSNSDNEELDFGDAFDVSAWENSQTNADGEFLESGARALKKINVHVVTFSTDTKKNDLVLKGILACSLKDLILAHARAASDYFKTSQYDKQMIDVTATYTKAIGKKLPDFFLSDNYDKYVAELTKALKFLSGKDVKKIKDAFDAYDQSAFRDKVVKNFPPGFFSKKTEKTTTKGEKPMKLINSDLAPLVDTILKIGEKSLDSAKMLTLVIVAFGYMTNGDAEMAYEYFDKAISASYNLNPPE